MDHCAGLSSGSLKNIQIRYFQGVLYHYVTEIGDGCVLGGGGGHQAGRVQVQVGGVVTGLSVVGGE